MSSQHPQYRDSTAYLQKMRQLQARGLGLVRTQILHHLEAASKVRSTDISGRAPSRRAPCTSL
jgi:hypothetical protein